MVFTPRDFSGALFKTEKENDRQPDYSGQCMVGGVSYWISCFVKNRSTDPKYDPAKKTYMSLSFTPKQQQQQGKRDYKLDPEKRHRPLPPPSALSEPHPPTGPDGEYEWNGDQPA